MDLESFLASDPKVIVERLARGGGSPVESINLFRSAVFDWAEKYLTDPKNKLADQPHEDALKKNEKLGKMQEVVDGVILSFLEEMLKETDLAAKVKKDIQERDKGLSVLKIIRGLRCNYNCRFCLEQTTDEEQRKYVEEYSDLAYSTERLRTAMLFARMAFGIKEINFSGGDPLVNKPKLLIEEISMAKRLGFPQITVLTNGSLLTKELIDSYCKAGMTNLTVSLHTKDAEDHKFLTQPKNDQNYHEHIVEMIKYASEKSGLIVRINTAKTKEYTESVDDLVKWAEGLGVQELTINEMIPANDFSSQQREPLPNKITGYMKQSEIGWGLSIFTKSGGGRLSVAICRFGGEDFALTQNKDLYLLPNGMLSQYLFDRSGGINY